MQNKINYSSLSLTKDQLLTFPGRLVNLSVSFGGVCRLRHSVVCVMPVNVYSSLAESFSLHFTLEISQSHSSQDECEPT
jgi:hypothetical protein